MIVRTALPIKNHFHIYRNTVAKGLRSKVISTALTSLRSHLKKYGFDKLYVNEIPYHDYIYEQHKSMFLAHFDLPFPDMTAIVHNPVNNDDIFKILNDYFKDLL